MGKVRFEVGSVVQFEYPRHNFHGVLSALERRRLRVESVRDLSTDPIERITFEIQPLLRRGRFLVIGQDLDKQAERRFYAESMRSVEVLSKVLPSRRQTRSGRKAEKRKTA